MGRIGSTVGTWAKKVVGEMIGELGGFAINGATELLRLLELLYYCRAKGYKETITDEKTKTISTNSNHTYIPELKDDEFINYSDYGYVFYDYDRGRIAEVIIDPNGLTVSRSIQDQDTYKISISMTVVRDFGKGKTRAMSDVNTFPNPKNIVLGLANGLKDLTKIPGYFASVVRDLSDGVKQLAQSGKEVEKAYKDSLKVWSTEMRAIKKDYHSSTKEMKNWGGNNKKDPMNRLVSQLGYSGRQIEKNSAAMISSWASTMYDVMPGYVENMFKGTDAVSQYTQSQNPEVYSSTNSSTTPTTGGNNLITKFEYPLPKNKSDAWVFSYGYEVEIKPEINDGDFSFKIKPDSTALPTNGSVALDSNSGKLTVRSYQSLVETEYTILAYYTKDNVEISKEAKIKISITLEANPITVVSYSPSTDSKLLLYKNSFHEFKPQVTGTLPMKFELKSILNALSVETNTLPEGMYLDSFSGKIFGLFTGSLESDKSVTLLVSNSKGNLEKVITFKDELILPTSITFSHYTTPPTPPSIYLLNLKKGDQVDLQITHNSNSVGFEVIPTLPVGLELDSVKGTIKGIADEVVSKEYIFKVSNAKGSASAVMKITITSDAQVTDNTDPSQITDTTTDENNVVTGEDSTLEIYAQARASYFKLKEEVIRNSLEAEKYISMYSENILIDDKLTISPIFTEKERYEVITDFNYIYLLGTLEFYVNFKAQFRLAENEDRFRIYQPTSSDSFYEIAKRFYGDSSYATEISSFNNLQLTETELPPTLLLPIENSLNLNIVNRINEFQPPYPIEKIKNELLGYDLKLTSDKDLALTVNGDLDLISGDEAILQSLSDILSIPQGSILSDSELGNPISQEGGILQEDEIIDNSINLGAVIMSDPRIKDANLLSTYQDGDTIIYNYSVTTITDDTFKIEVS